MGCGMPTAIWRTSGPIRHLDYENLMGVSVIRVGHRQLFGNSAQIDR